MCSPNSAFIKFSNQLDVTLTLRLAGPYPATIILRPRSSRNICLVPGSYSVTASARGFINYHATYQYHTGPCQCNIFGTFVIPGSCNCSQNHAYYSPPCSFTALTLRRIPADERMSLSSPSPPGYTPF
jgi:hypothetical protein